MSRLVVDASAWVELLCGREHGPDLVDRLLDGRELHIPALCDVEVVAALRKIALAGQLSVKDVESALDNYRSLRVRRHGHELLLPRMLDLRDNFTAYDATCVALAEGLEASLVTLDAPLAQVAVRFVDVEPIELL